ncbi:MAG: aminoacyl-tRNA deacylase [Terracidiphilus sp.]
MKTNGARFLSSLGIPFELREYEVDANNPEDLTAIAVARKIGMPAEQVFKTLLTTDGARDYVFAVVPGDAALDFKKLARLAGWRKAEMAPLKDVQPLTGYIRGGVTVFGAKKPYPVFVDETAILFDRISVSAGTRGTQLVLTPDDYLRAAAALGAPVQTADIAKAVNPPHQEGSQ